MPSATASPTAILQSYLQALYATRSTGATVAETSFYDAPSTLLNQVGATLRPTVRCGLTGRNRGVGLPDGGLFAAD